MKHLLYAVLYKRQDEVVWKMRSGSLVGMFVSELEYS